ncbi:hypothetical protein M662_06525 [Bacillus sp. SB49]|uniref:hypothetical protein n=1 Tax=Bacillaceae TaxID=186817 RepID=UPI0002A5156D|nr:MULTISPECIES: hypothetical protein [Bacillaceae]ELK45629.1 hypothetical protein D479_13847 [Halobacillus sp. BAB-2008]QHT46159.1 hypothetical protein M662_06525 [Bacillus sp. SB49]
MDFFGWNVVLDKSLKPYIDKDHQRMAVLTAEDDDIHIALEMDEDGSLVMHPRWNVKIVLREEKLVELTTNS